MGKDLDTKTTKVADHPFARSEHKCTIEDDGNKVSARSSSEEKAKEDAMDQYENLTEDN